MAILPYTVAPSLTLGLIMVDNLHSLFKDQQWETNPVSSYRNVNELIPFDTSLHLLDSDNHMSPRMRTRFGDIRAIQHESHEDASFYLRKSSIHQVYGNSKILDALLLISKAVVPSGFIEDLRNTDKGFGDLLSYYNIESVIANRKLFSATVDGIYRLGRQHSILSSRNGALICHIQELLSSESDLSKLEFNQITKSSACSR
jgi:hypothetical protein